mmetsp:Transcript_9092/g.32208  ORF Transcript_9092/g.32208 Transcript_9092/m.32208 type:complete len:322 (-) Transcript_9092:1226-2191(-)
MSSTSAGSAAAKCTRTRACRSRSGGNGTWSAMRSACTAGSTQVSNAWHCHARMVLLLSLDCTTGRAEALYGPRCDRSEAPHWHSRTLPRHWPATLSRKAWRSSMKGQTWSVTTSRRPASTQATSKSRSSASALGTMALKRRPPMSEEGVNSPKALKLELEMYWPPRFSTLAARSISSGELAQPTQSKIRSKSSPSKFSTQSFSRKLTTRLAPKLKIQSMQLGGTVAVTKAPTRRAICTAKWPAPRFPPSTSTLESPVICPSKSPLVDDPFPVKRAWYAVSPDRGRPATLERATSAGTLHIWRSGQTQYPAQAPAGPNVASS